ncbi:MAG: hypothetical protein ACXIUB_08910 [Wenzhouxiangella sp.]
MNTRNEATLASTGEKVILLGSRQANGSRYLCLLPPQQPWHRPRVQEIRGEKLRFHGAG